VRVWAARQRRRENTPVTVLPTIIRARPTRRNGADRVRVMLMTGEYDAACG